MLNIKSLCQPPIWKLNSKGPKVSGFTLIELLVAIVIIGIMLTLVLGSYWTFLQTQQKMAMSRELQSEVRFAFNRFTDKVRSSTIDYSSYAPGQPCAITGSNLCLVSLDGTKHLFAYDSTDQVLNMAVVPATAAASDPILFEPLLSPDKFVVTGQNFDFSPTLDPSILANPQLQPKVTFYLEVSPRSGLYQDLVIESQTTISSRQY